MNVTKGFFVYLPALILIGLCGNVFAQEKISCGLQIGKAISLPISKYPKKLGKIKSPVIVTVRAIVDISGKVISTQIISNASPFDETARFFASYAIFTPTVMAGKEISLTAVIAYEFSPKRNVKIVASEVEATPEIEKRTAIECEKLARVFQTRGIVSLKAHSSVRDLILRLIDGRTLPKPDERLFVKDGTANVTVQVFEADAETTAELQKIGFVVKAEIAEERTLFGEIDIDKLLNLINSRYVKFASPLLRSK